MTSLPDNIALAQEAIETEDCKRQIELASHPSAVVLWHLVKNPHLCSEAAEIIGNDKVAHLRSITHEQLENLL